MGKFIPEVTLHGTARLGQAKFARAFDESVKRALLAFDTYRVPKRVGLSK